jgi:sec-independent protein translocase protein TatB
MFDIGWSELVVIAVVALIAIGPKELPGVLRMVGQWMGKARRMASEFQGQFNEAMREAEMADLKKSFDDIDLSLNTPTTPTPTTLADAEAHAQAIGTASEPLAITSEAQIVSAELPPADVAHSDLPKADVQNAVTPSPDVQKDVKAS